MNFRHTTITSQGEEYLELTQEASFIIARVAETGALAFRVQSLGQGKCLIEDYDEGVSDPECIASFWEQPGSPLEIAINLAHSLTQGT